jgi:hypothetical protein
MDGPRALVRGTIMMALHDANCGRSIAGLYLQKHFLMSACNCKALGGWRTLKL